MDPEILEKEGSMYLKVDFDNHGETNKNASEWQKTDIFSIVSKKMKSFIRKPFLNLKVAKYIYFI